ncbi:glycosyltransferase family 39 protein [bacterium]|nr:glycosyltransferase family 39 protein [candidate division CSSED10-310 bacterium]
MRSVPVIMVVGLAVLLRILAPTADPPADLSWSGGYYSDEGFWCHNARNQVLFGKAVQDDWNNMYMSPIVHLFTLLSFILFGVGPIQVRAVSMVCAALLLALVWCWGRAAGNRHGLFMLVFYGCSYVAVSYNRLALLETPLTLFMTGAVTAVVCIPPRRVVAGDLAAGILAGFAFVTKTTALFILPVLVLTVWARDRDRRHSAGLRHLAPLCMGFAAIAAVWLVSIRIPHAGLLEKYNTYYRSQQSWEPLNVARNIITQPCFLYLFRSPIMLLLTMLGFVALWSRGRGWWRRLPAPATAALGWFVLQWTELAVFGYRPLRYYVPILVPMAFLSATAITSISAVPARSGRRLLVPLLVVLIGQAAVVVVDSLVPLGIHGITNNPAIPRLGALCFLATIPLLLLITRRRGWLSAAAVTLFLAVNLFHYGRWFHHREYAVQAARQYLTRLSPTTIGGQWAPQLCLGTSHHAVPIWKGYVNDIDPLGTGGVRYLLSWDYSLGNEWLLHHRWFPDAMAVARELNRFSIKDSQVVLSELPPRR